MNQNKVIYPYFIFSLTFINEKISFISLTFVSFV